MGDLHHLPDLRKAEREASEWIARLDADDASPQDRARFDAWRATHPARAEAYEKLLQTWRQFAAAGPFVRAVSFAQSVSEPGEARSTRRYWMCAGLAASLVAVLLSVLYFAAAPSGARISTSVGEQLTVLLQDGSSVQLNSDSIVRVEFSAHARVIRLEQGEAFFKVAHDSQRPFWVASGSSWVRAVGTAFNVHLRSAGVQVIVSEGVVKVGRVNSGDSITPSDDALAGATTSLLVAGHQVDLVGATASTRKLSTKELAYAVSWRDGTLYFENETLGEVVAEVGRYTTLRLRVDDARLRQLIVGGTFRANPQGAEALLTLLEQGFGLRVRREGDRAYIEAKVNE